MKLPKKLQTGHWSLINHGMSGAFIYQGTYEGRPSFLKVTPHGHRFPAKVEHERIHWLKGRVPVAEVLTYIEDDKHQFLVTADAQGVGLLEFNADEETRIAKFAGVIRLIHDLPVEQCPYKWTVDEQIQFARSGLGKRHAILSSLDTEFQGRSLDTLFQEMMTYKPTPEMLDLVVVHGDPYTDNIIVDPETGELKAFLDVGHVSVADRYTDLAMIYDELIQNFGEDGWQTFLNCYGIEKIDDKKLYFYRLFNEFL